jgi:hypothetical protein
MDKVKKLRREKYEAVEGLHGLASGLASDLK